MLWLRGANTLRFCLDFTERSRPFSVCVDFTYSLGVYVELYSFSRDSISNCLLGQHWHQCIKGCGHTKMMVAYVAAQRKSCLIVHCSERTPRIPHGKAVGSDQERVAGGIVCPSNL